MIKRLKFHPTAEVSLLLANDYGKSMGWLLTGEGWKPTCQEP